MAEPGYLNNVLPNHDGGDISPSPVCGDLSDSAREITRQTAGFAMRSLAAIIDRLLLSALGIAFFVIGLLATGTGVNFHMTLSAPHNLRSVFVLTYATMVLVEIAYYTYFHACTGQTPGKMLCGITVVGSRGQVISYNRALCRWLGYLVSSLPLYLGFFWVAIDPDHQAWHDKIAKTYVVKI